MNKILLVAFVFFLYSGCTRKSESNPAAKEMAGTRKALIGANRIMVRKDYEKIRTYAQVNKLPLRETETGLWYLIEEKGKGEKARKGQLATVSYDVTLLNGTPCYNSDSLGLKEFRIGQGGVESGLEEGILMLRRGDKATFIMPPHLAHGLTGDGDRIPARSIIIYHVELRKLEPR